MKKLMVFVFLLMMFPLVSSEAVIMMEQQPKAVYNLGDRINIPLTVTSTQGVYDFLQVSLICDSRESVFPKDFIDLASGEVKKVDKSVLLIRRFVGDVHGSCKLKAFLENDPTSYVISNDFIISNIMNLEVKTDKNSFNPGEVVALNGKAFNENGKDSGGIFDLKLVFSDGTEILSQGGVIINGFFSSNIELPNGTRAGQYILSVNTHETDPIGEITNLGSTTKELSVNQVPTNLEIVFENEKIEPGTDLRVKAVLWDQTGEKMTSVSDLKIKNNDGRIVNQTSIQTDEFFKIHLAYNEAPLSWMVEALSEGIEVESNFTISEKTDVGIEIVDRTLILTNKGNVPYNDTATVKVGNETLYVDVYLEVDEEKRYLLKAPDGEYTVEVLSGDSLMTGNVALTGKSVDVSEASGSGFIKYSFVWLFIILVLGFATAVVFRRGYQKSFVGYVSSKVKRKSVVDSSRSLQTNVFSGSLVSPRNRAELSLSIQGNKQEVCVVAINLKNASDIRSEKGGAKETLQKIVDMAEESKASTYEGNNSLFLLLVPERTKTFGNEKTALNLAKKARELILEHNKIFQQKISFGISLNCGSMIVKQDKNLLKFMSLGALMTDSKKISSFAVNDVLLSEKMNDKLRSSLKTAKQEKGNLSVYSIKEIRKNTDNKEFLHSFLERNKRKEDN